MEESWGPHYIVPSLLRKAYSGKVVLLESLDSDLLREDLISQGFPLEATKVSNPWYYRKKNTATWVLIGESEDRESDFPVVWETSALENGVYEVMGLMHVCVEEGGLKKTIARQNVTEVVIQN